MQRVSGSHAFPELFEFSLLIPQPKATTLKRNLSVQVPWVVALCVSHPAPHLNMLRMSCSPEALIQLQPREVNGCVVVYRRMTLMGFEKTASIGRATREVGTSVLHIRSNRV